VRAFRLSLLLALPLVFSACDSLDPDPQDVRRGFIERVVITQIPLTNPNSSPPGEGWDGGGAEDADVYFRLLGVNDSPDIINGEEDGVVAVGDASSTDGTFGGVGSADLPLVYTLDAATVPASEITVLDRTLRLEVKDDDSPGSTDDVMAVSQAFTLFDQIPSTLPNDRRVAFTVTNAAGTMTAQITVRYER